MRREKISLDRHLKVNNIFLYLLYHIIAAGCRNEFAIKKIIVIFVSFLGNGGRPIFHSSSSILACNNINNVDGKVARWAVAFDKLLEDKIGLGIFRVSRHNLYYLFVFLRM